MIDCEEEPYGSARWCSEAEAIRAGLMRWRGLPFGYFGRRLLCLDADAPGLLCAGSGSGKCRDFLAEAILRSADSNQLIIDPKGELASITIGNFLRHKAYAYCFNPYGLHALPHHRVNPLDILRLHDPRFYADCRFIAQNLIVLSGSANGQYFELGARVILESLLVVLVEQNGAVDFADLFNAINSLMDNPTLWEWLLKSMEQSTYPSVRRTGGELRIKQKDAPKEFYGIYSTLTQCVSFLGDPRILSSLEHPDFSLGDLCLEDGHPRTVFLNAPAEYAQILAPLNRVMISVTMLYKSRKPQAPRVTLICDEAGQLGRFEALMSAITYGRGAGLRVIAVFQDIGQIVRNYDEASLQGFIGSSQLRAFFGVRDYKTAKLISDMLGSQSLRYDNKAQQEEARRKQWDAFQRFMRGEDPFASGYDFSHFGNAAHNRSKMQRPLMTPDEIMAMPEDRAIAFVSGLDLPPIYINKYPYYERKDLRGLWLPNPMHPPIDRVTLPGFWGTRTVRVLTEDVPAHLASFPQHQSGTVSYVEGFRPW